MSNVLQFKRLPTRERATPLPNGKLRITGFAVALQARPGAVFLITDHVELGLSPAQARELADDLNESADDADGGICS